MWYMNMQRTMLVSKVMFLWYKLICQVNFVQKSRQSYFNEHFKFVFKVLKRMWKCLCKCFVINIWNGTNHFHFKLPNVSGSSDSKVQSRNQNWLKCEFRRLASNIIWQEHRSRTRLRFVVKWCLFGYSQYFCTSDEITNTLHYNKLN